MESLLDLNTFTTTNSSVYLIDENLCLKDSVEILNHNFQNWQSQINSIDNTLNDVSGAIDAILQESQEWTRLLNILDVLNTSIPEAFATVENIVLKPISITYPVFIPVTEWTTKIKIHYFYSNAVNWLNLNFPVEDFSQNQIIKLNFLFQETKNFRVSYEASYLEPCIATPLNSIECTGTPVGLYVGCNHYGGLAGTGACTNAYEPTGPQAHFCTSEYIAVAPSNNCWSTDPFILTTEYSYYGTEVITSKSITVEFILQGDMWALKQ